MYKSRVRRGPTATLEGNLRGTKERKGKERKVSKRKQKESIGKRRTRFAIRIHSIHSSHKGLFGRARALYLLLKVRDVDVGKDDGIAGTETKHARAEQE